VPNDCHGADLSHEARKREHITNDVLKMPPLLALVSEKTNLEEFELYAEPSVKSDEISLDQLRSLSNSGMKESIQTSVTPVRTYMMLDFSTTQPVWSVRGGTTPPIRPTLFHFTIRHKGTTSVLPDSVGHQILSIDTIGESIVEIKQSKFMVLDRPTLHRRETYILVWMLFDNEFTNLEDELVNRRSNWIAYRSEAADAIVRQVSSVQPRYEVTVGTKTCVHGWTPIQLQNGKFWTLMLGWNSSEMADASEWQTDALFLTSEVTNVSLTGKTTSLSHTDTILPMEMDMSETVTDKRLSTVATASKQFQAVDYAQSNHKIQQPGESVVLYNEITTSMAMDELEDELAVKPLFDPISIFKKLKGKVDQARKDFPVEQFKDLATFAKMYVGSSSSDINPLGDLKENSRMAATAMMANMASSGQLGEVKTSVQPYLASQGAESANKITLDWTNRISTLDNRV